MFFFVNANRCLHITKRTIYWRRKIHQQKNGETLFITCFTFCCSDFLKFYLLSELFYLCTYVLSRQLGDFCVFWYTWLQAKLLSLRDPIPTKPTHVQTFLHISYTRIRYASYFVYSFALPSHCWLKPNCNTIGEPAATALLFRWTVTTGFVVVL